MEFFKRLFGGGGGAGRGGRIPGDEGLYFYVRPNGCEEVVRVRVNPNNDLSLMDSADGEPETYWVHKLVRGEHCRTMVEFDVYFDGKRRFNRHEVKHGLAVDEAAWQAWTVSQEAADALRGGL